MSLNVNHSPTKYFFSRNRNYVEVETDNYLVSANYGVKAVGYFVNLSNAVVNKILTIKWGATTRVYTFKAATNIASLEIAVIGTMTPQEHMIELANALMGDATLAAAFDVTPFQTALYITAKAAGTAFSLTLSSTNVTGAIYNDTPGTDNILSLPRPNYKVNLTLFGDNGLGGWKQLVLVSKEPFENKIRCDLKEYINNHLEYDVPVFSLALATKCENVIKRFYLKVQESYGYPPAIVAATVLPGTIMANATDTNPYYSLKAGFDEISARLVPDNQQNYYSTNNAFLTRQNRRKTVSSKQYEFLYFLFPSTLAGNACIRSTWKKKDGTVVLTGDGYFTAAIVKNDVYCFPINYPGSIFDQVEDIATVEVFVKNNTSGAAISEVFTYVKDTEYRTEENFIYFFNSDGGLDTVRGFGVRENSSDFERETAARTITLTSGELDGTEETTFTQKVNKASTFSGWVPKSELIYIEELLLSRKAFIYGNDYGQGDIKIPITILTKQLVKHKTKQHLYGYVIEYREAFTSEISQANYYPI
jgi:hypothetical protein